MQRIWEKGKYYSRLLANCGAPPPAAQEPLLKHTEDI